MFGSKKKTISVCAGLTCTWIRSNFHDTRELDFKTFNSYLCQRCGIRSSPITRIGGIPMLLGDDPPRRPKDHQEHADTGSSIWDGAVALAKAPPDATGCRHGMMWFTPWGHGRRLALAKVMVISWSMA